MATTALDDKLVPKVLAIIDRFGKDVTFTVPDNEANIAYDTATGVGTLGPTTPVTRKATPPAKYHDFRVDGARIRAGDVEIGVAASSLTFTPLKGMLVVIDAIDWYVENVERVYTGESVALWTLQLRN